MPKLKGKQEKEISEALSHGREMELMVKGQGWQDARSYLMEEIGKISDISSLIDVAPQNIPVELRARSIAKDIVLSFIASIEGDAEAYLANKVALEQIRSRPYLEYKN